MRNGGFTLLELLVVIAIIGLLARLMFLIPRDGFAVAGAAGTIAQLVTRTRMEALRRNEYVGFQVDKVGNKVFLFEDLDRNLAYSTTADKIIPSAGLTLASGDYPSTKFGSSLVSPGYTFVFDTRGIPRTLNSMTIPVSNASGSKIKTVSVTPQGRATVQ